MSATPEQIDDAVVEHVAQAISFNDNGNYTPNYKWSLVPEVLQDSYRRNARAAITAYLSATSDAQAERVRVLESALTTIGHSLVCAPVDYAEHNASELLRAGNIARAALKGEA